MAELARSEEKDQTQTAPEGTTQGQESSEDTGEEAMYHKPMTFAIIFAGLVFSTFIVGFVGLPGFHTNAL
jgi:hypothetical protein